MESSKKNISDAQKTDDEQIFQEYKNIHRDIREFVKQADDLESNLKEYPPLDSLKESTLICIQETQDIILSLVKELNDHKFVEARKRYLQEIFSTMKKDSITPPHSISEKTNTQ